MTGLYGGLNVEVYGSTINEIGSKDCDVDMVFLPVDPNVAKTVSLVNYISVHGQPSCVCI